MPERNRPISPHLSIYKPQITSVLSILHRVTGVGIFFLIVIAVWGCLILQSISYGSDENLFSTNGFFSYFLQLYIILFIFCISYHLCAGIRYLVWTFGVGFDIEKVTMSAYIVIGSSLVLTTIAITLFYY